jgi:hypothetical protein
MTTYNFSFYLQCRLIQTSQTGGQQHSITSPLVFPGLFFWQRTIQLYISLQSKMFFLIHILGAVWYGVHI